MSSNLDLTLPADVASELRQIETLCERLGYHRHALLAAAAHLDGLAHINRMGVSVQDVPGVGRVVVDETKQVETKADPECICGGNWRALVKEFDSLIGTRFKDRLGKTWTFFGLVHTDEDYYYGMRDDSGVYRLLSCVGSLDGGHGFMAIDGPRPEGKTSLEIGLASIRPPRM